MSYISKSENNLQNFFCQKCDSLLIEGGYKLKTCGDILCSNCLNTIIRNQSELKCCVCQIKLELKTKNEKLCLDFEEIPCLKDISECLKIIEKSVRTTRSSNEKDEWFCSHHKEPMFCVDHSLMVCQMCTNEHSYHNLVTTKNQASVQKKNLGFQRRKEIFNRQMRNLVSNQSEIERNIKTLKKILKKSERLKKEVEERTQKLREEMSYWNQIEKELDDKEWCKKEFVKEVKERMENVEGEWETIDENFDYKTYKLYKKLFFSFDKKYDLVEYTYLRKKYPEIDFFEMEENNTVNILNKKYSTEQFQLIFFQLSKYNYNKKILKLNLDGTVIGELGVKKFSQFLSKSLRLTSLSLNGCKIGCNALRLITTSLFDNSTITNLNLKGNFISDSGANLISDLLLNNTTLKILDLSWNNLKLESSKYLHNALSINNSLTYLNLSSNEFFEKSSIELLCEGLSINTSLTHVDLSLNPLFEYGAQCIQNLLSKNTTLTSISLNQNQFGEKGAQYIGNALKYNTSLRSISLNSNIFKEGTIYILESLKSNQCLNYLSLENNNSFDTRIGEIICDLTQMENSSLNDIKLGWNSIPKSILSKIEENLSNKKRNMTLPIIGT